MTSNLDTCSVVSWLEHLLLLFPPSGVLLIGAGAGTGPWFQWLQEASIPNVTLLEPDDGRFERLLGKSKECANWRLQKKAVAESSRTTAFYLATLSGEGGLVQPENLRGIWPNISTLNKVQIRTTTVAELQAERSNPSSWLIVDCFPALPIIQGAASTLGDLDVIVLRAVVDAPAVSEALASEDELVQYLTGQGYRHLGTAAGRNPKLGHALFVRDITATIQSLQSEVTRTKQALNAEAQRGLRELEHLQRICDAHAKLAQDRAIKIDQLKQSAVVTADREEQFKTQLHELRQASVRAKQARDSLDTYRVQCEAQSRAWELERACLLRDLDRARQSSAASHEKVLTLERQLRYLTLSNETNVHLKCESVGASSHPLSRLEAVSKNSSFGDADIEDLIHDIAPFFYGKSLTYVDIGAFVGEVFIKLKKSKELKFREAHLFEPSPASFHKLKENTKDLSIPTLHCYHMGVTGEREVRTFLSAGSMTKIVDAATGNAGAMDSAFSVECRALDSFRDAFTDGRIDFLKIDVEGRELEVLEGAKGLLSQQAIDFIYLEVGFNVNGTQQTYFGSLDAFLQKYGYRAFRIYEQKNEWQKDCPWLRRCNVAYMSKQFADANGYNASRELYNLRKKIVAMKLDKSA